MDKPMSDFRFRAMAFLFQVRDLIRPRENILAEVELEPNLHVLDFGCGPGSYTLLAAQQVGATGKVYALDIQPTAIKYVQEAAQKRGLTNIKTIRSDCATGLADESIDVVLLYDIFHMFGNPNAILAELHRVLKPSRLLSFNDHHMQESDILARVTASGLFKLARKGKRTYSFVKQ